MDLFVIGILSGLLSGADAACLLRKSTEGICVHPTPYPLACRIAAPVKRGRCSEKG